MDEHDFSNIYYIPANYTDSGRLFGGMLETRNTIEAVLIVLALGYPEIKWVPLSATYKVVLMVVTLLPIGIFALMGVNGDSLGQTLTHMLRFAKKRRRLSMHRIGPQALDDATPKPKRRKNHNKRRNRNKRKGNPE